MARSPEHARRVGQILPERRGREAREGSDDLQSPKLAFTRIDFIKRCKASVDPGLSTPPPRITSITPSSASVLTSIIGSFPF
jgi:hypothetical protein